MTDAEYARKLDELDRLLNDPDVPMEPEKVWSLLAEIAQRDMATAPCRAALRPDGQAMLGGDQKLAVAFRPGDRAFGDAQHPPARQRRPPGGDTLAHRLVNRGVAHHALAADGLAARPRTAA